MSLGHRWTELWEFNDDSTMLVENASRYNPAYKRGWLRLADGTVVGMIHWSNREGESERPCICDIEVREEYRGQGYAKRLIHAVEDQIGDRLHTTGSFTPEGRAALSETPQRPGFPVEGPKHDFRSMNFVHDWENLQEIR